MKYWKKQSEIQNLNKKFNFATKILDEYDSDMCFGVKVNIAIRDQTIHCGSKILQNTVAPYNATVINILLQHKYKINMITTMNEFAMGSTGMSPLNGHVFHPDETEFNSELYLNPGGSSAGSAVAVALDTTSFSLGSDTGGSVRMPAALCKIIGFKPSYGAISRYGLTMFSSSCDQIGIFSKTLTVLNTVFTLLNVQDCMDYQTIDYYVKFGSKVVKTLPIVYLNFNVLQNSGILNDTNQYIQYIQMLKSNNTQHTFNMLDADTTQQLISIFVLSQKIYSGITGVEAFSNLTRFNGRLYIQDPNINQTHSNQVPNDCNFFHLTNKIRNMYGDVVKKRLTNGIFYLQHRKNYQSILDARVYIQQFCTALLAETILLIPTLTTDKMYSTNGNIDGQDSVEIFLPWVNLMLGCSVSIYEMNFNAQFVSCQGNDRQLLETVSKLFKVENRGHENE